MIEETHLDFLTSEHGCHLLESLAGDNLSEANSLSILTRLRKHYTPEQSASALTLARLRLKAVDKFGSNASKMFFIDSALQQASDPLVRHYRSQRLSGLSILDICCGVGADSLAFSANGISVMGIDIDPLRIAMAKLNAAALGLSSLAQFAVADAHDAMTTGFDAIFFDPARRDEQGKRIFDVEQYHPSLSLVKKWQANQIVVKLSPGVQLEQLHSYGGRVEFISVNGDLKESVLWLHEDKHSGILATLLTEAGVFHWERVGVIEQRPLSAPRNWLVEPDPAIIRAGLVADIALAYDGFLLDDTIAYFTTDDKPDSVWLRSWEILDWMPFQLKRLRAYLREHHIGRVTIKKRGSAISLQEIMPKLKLKGNNACTLIFTRYNGQYIVMICADYTV